MVCHHMVHYHSDPLGNVLHDGRALVPDLIVDSSQNWGIAGLLFGFRRNGTMWYAIPGRLVVTVHRIYPYFKF